jgi:hypothetical protein
MVDEFVEAVVAEVARRASTTFKWAEEDSGNRVYIQLTPAHGWWLQLRKRQGKGALELSAIKNQLGEAPYFLGTKATSEALMYGIDLPTAVEGGLDVVSSVGPLNEMRIIL